MTQEEKKESFFKKLFWNSSDNTEKVTNIAKKAVLDFDSWVNMIEWLIAEKNWSKALKIIEKVRENEKKNTLLLLKNSKEEQKEAINKIHINKLGGLLDFEKSIEDLIRKEKEEKKSLIIDEKIIYIKNRLDFYIKNENYNKAQDILNDFYKKYNEEDRVKRFYDKEMEIFDSLKTQKKWFFWNLFWNKDKKEIENKKEDKIVTLAQPVPKKEIEIKNVETNILEKEQVLKIENQEKNIEQKTEQKAEQKAGFFSKMFSKNEEIKQSSNKANNFDSAIELLDSLIKSNNFSKARLGINEIRKKEETAFNLLSDENKKKQENIFKWRILKLDELTKKLDWEIEFNSKIWKEISVDNKIEIKEPEVKLEIVKESQDIANLPKIQEEITIEEQKNRKVEDKLIDNEVKTENIENKPLWISELKKDVHEELKEVNNTIIEPKEQVLEKPLSENKKEDALMNNENKEEMKWFFWKFFNKDLKNLDKVGNLFESLMKVKDLDKAISAVEALKSIEWKNVVIKEDNGLTDPWVSKENDNVEKSEAIDFSKINDGYENPLNKQNKIKVEDKNVALEKLKEEEQIRAEVQKKELEESKKIKVEEIKDFDWAMKWIEYFININDWVRAKSWIEEIKIKEEKAFNELYDKIDIEKEQNKQREVYHKKLIKIEKMSDHLENKEIEYNEKKEVEKFRIKFIQIKEKLDELIWGKKYYEAMELINSFFEENRNSIVVINFFNKWKNVIQKKIKQQDEEKDRALSKNAKKEAELLIWENINLSSDNTNKSVNLKNGNSFFKNISEKLNLYKKIKLKLKEKRLVDEVTLLIESQSEVDELSKKSRLESMHMWLIKELDNDKLLWYELYAKILWKDKISWDTFWFSEDDTTYKFFLWDATWHWLQAWLIVTLLTRLFYNFSKSNFLEQLVFEVNNWLKQDLKSWNFITWIFFEVDKKNLNSLKFVWMWHEPMIVFRKETMDVEKYIAWWLAAWIRIISDINNIKTNSIKLNNWDIVFIYSDWMVESRNSENKLLWVDWFAEIIKKTCINFIEWRIIDIYWEIIEQVKTYRWWSVNFFDDASVFILKRNSDKDVIDKKSLYLKDLSIKEGLSRKNIRGFEWKTKEEIEKDLHKIRKEKQLKLIISNLEKLYITWEILKLKQEAIRYIKEWFIHKQINRYLKKAINSERKYKIDLKDQKMKSRYTVLKELLKKWDYTTVIREASDIIASDWNITI